MHSAPDELLLPGESGTPEEKGRTAQTRLRDGASARSISAKLDEDDRKRSYRRALTKAMVDGAKPFPEDSSGMTNLNFQDGKAIMQQSGVPFYSIFAGVRNFAEIRPSFNPQDPEHDRWGEKISRRFHELLSNWNGFDWNVQQASYWMRLHGVGPCYFDKPMDWRFRSLDTGCAQVPNGSASCVDDRLPYIKIKVAYRVHELYEFIKDAAAAKSAGYNVDAVKRAIMHACRTQSWASSGNGAINGWEVFEQQFNNNDIASTARVDFVNCVHLLVREYSGKISKFIITEEAIPASEGDADKKDDQFLFQSIDAYESYERCLVVFFKDIGDGTWHSVKGYASDAFDTLVVTNQLYCAMIDAARVDSTIILEFPNTTQRDKFDKFQIKRGITKLPVGAQIRQARLQGSMDGAMTISRLLSEKLNNNIGNFQGRGMSREDGKGETVTAREVEARVAKEASLTQGEMTLFYSYLDCLYEEIYRRASDPDTNDEEAKAFQEKCLEDGVPLEAMANPEYVRASRESGYGSPAMRDLRLQQLREIAPSLPTEGQQNLLDAEISAIAGPDKVEFFNPRTHQPDINDWAASIENETIRSGVVPPTISGMDPIIHLQSHLPFAADYLEPIKEAMDAGASTAEELQEAFFFTANMAEHCQPHLAQLAGDPTRKETGDYFTDSLQQIVAFNSKLRSAIITARKEAELAAAEQQQATALSALDQAKLQSVAVHDQIAAAKTATKIRNDTAKTVNSIRLKGLQVAADAQLKRLQAVAGGNDQ